MIIDETDLVKFKTFTSHLKYVIDAARDKILQNVSKLVIRNDNKMLARCKVYKVLPAETFSENADSECFEELQVKVKNK